MARTAIILAAGRGSRLDVGGIKQNFSKPLMDIGGRSLLARTVDCCRTAGAERILVVTGFRADLVAREAERLSHGDIETVYNAQWTKSNGLSLLCCRERVDEDFSLLMADHVFDPSILADLMALEPMPGSVTLAVDRKIDRIFDLDDATKVQIEGGRIVSISKQLARYNAIDCGLFLCTPGIFGALQQAMRDRGDCSLSDGMAIIGGQGRFFPFDIGHRWWQDVDTPEMMANALAMLAQVDLASLPAASLR